MEQEEDTNFKLNHNTVALQHSYLPPYNQDNGL